MSVKARTQSLLHSAGRKTLADAGLLPYAVTALISYTGTAALLHLAKVEVASSSLVARSKKETPPNGWCFFSAEQAGTPGSPGVLFIAFAR